MNETLTREETETITMEEIERCFHGEWVFLENPVTDERMEILSGTLLGHSKKRSEIDAQSIKLRPRRSAIFYVGEPVEEIWINL